MIINLPFLYKFKKGNHYFKAYFILSSLRAAFLVFLLTANMYAQNSVVIPNSTINSSVIVPFSNTATTYQSIIDDSQLASLSGKYINSISFRLPTSLSSSWPSTNIAYPNFQVFLSNGVDPANRQLNFALNVVGTQTLVRSGSLIIPAGSFTVGSTPNAFSYDIVFDTPYLYNNGNNLVVEIRHTGNGVSTQTSVDSVHQSAPGQGTLFTACYQTASLVSPCNFGYIKINAQDELGVQSVVIINDFSVYPNPAKDFIYLKSAGDITKITILNIVGQQIMSLSNSLEEPKIDISYLEKGVYIIQMMTKAGAFSSSKFIKE